VANVTMENPERFEGDELWRELDRLSRMAGAGGCVTLPARTLETLPPRQQPGGDRPNIAERAMDLAKLALHVTGRIPIREDMAHFVRLVRALDAEVENATEAPKELEEE